MIKFGPSEGNSGAIIRWGNSLDNGVWIAWKHWKYLYKQFRIRQGYIALSLLSIQWGNK